MRLERRYDRGLDLRRRNTSDGAGSWCVDSPQTRLRYVVTITYAVLGCVGGTHRVAAIVEQESAQQRVRPVPGRCAVRPLGCQLSLNRVKQFWVHERRLWPGLDCILVADLANVKAVAQHVKERALGERNTATGAAV